VGADEVVESVEAVEQPAEEKPSRREAIKAENADRKGRPESAERPAGDERRERSRQYGRDDLGPAPVGFGEDVPAFMKIPARV